MEKWTTLKTGTVSRCRQSSQNEFNGFSGCLCLIIFSGKCLKFVFAVVFYIMVMCLYSMASISGFLWNTCCVNMCFFLLCVCLVILFVCVDILICFLFILFYCYSFDVCLLTRNKTGIDLDGRRGGEELRGKHCMEKNIFNKINKNQKTLSWCSPLINMCILPIFPASTNWNIIADRRNSQETKKT